MRMLLMVSNNQMALRELYTVALDSHSAGWATSFMSGQPSGMDSIASGFDAVVYELGSAETAERVRAVKGLRRNGIEAITHVEGREAAAWTTELHEAGALVVPHPITVAGITETLDALLGQGRSGKKRVGLGERLRRTFTG